MKIYSYLLDKKLEMCTGSDLEAIVAGCLGRHKLWGDPSSLRVRKFRDAGYRDPTIILPGGRWAIMFSMSAGNAVAVDLHSHEQRSSNLFRPEKRPMEVQVVLQTLEAGFCTHIKMATVSTYADDLDDRVQIWLIEPSYDNAGHVHGLKAKLLSSFSGGPCRKAKCHSLSGPFLALLFHSDDIQQVYAVVIDWEKADGAVDYGKIQKHVLPLTGRRLAHTRVGEILINHEIHSDRFGLGTLSSPERHAAHGFSVPSWLRTMGSMLR